MATIEIDDKKIIAEDGKMIIEVADAEGISIPRFCYHKKLSIAANCRMCLVEVENVAKPVPACATPITDGMKVYTKSPLALSAQKSAMEFLLINHPLDCPICDQGGECELQDLSVGYGSGISRYADSKRVVDDPDLGPLVDTNMTRCIHCTRCVRFGEEIAGLRELGSIGRGENTSIGTYVAHSLQSEISGNVIDLCPVGALVSKPYRFTARPWELQQRPTIAPHDCLGSNIYVHMRQQEVMRVAPKDNEAINETWISDRDRFSYLGLKSEERIGKPLVKQNGQWLECDWETALTTTVLSLKRIIKQQGIDNVAALASPNATVEELYLLQKLMRALGCHHIDHRIHQTDFADQEFAPLFPGMTIPYEDLEHQTTFLLIGSNLPKEQPLASVRVRKAMMDHDATVMAVNMVDYPFGFNVAEKIISHPESFAAQLAGIAKALVGEQSLPAETIKLLADVTPNAEQRAIAKHLRESDSSIILLGALALNHPTSSAIRSLAQLIAQLSQSAIAYMTEGCNSVGAWLAGALPHREAAGHQVKEPGLTANKILKEQLKAYVLLNIEPELDCNNPAMAMRAMHDADLVVAFSVYRTDAIMQYADVILPITPFTETSGTYVNVTGTWQSFHACMKPFDQVRPAWKVLRVLGNLFDLEGFDYLSSREVRDELKALVERVNGSKEQWYCPKHLGHPLEGLRRTALWPIYASDPLVRRANALQQSEANEALAIYVSPDVAKQFNLRQGRDAIAIQNNVEVNLPVMIDERFAENSVYIPNGYPQTAVLGDSFGPIKIK